MRAIRVLVVDDSVVARRMISDVLDAEPGIEVAGTANNGRVAIAKVDELAPDLVTLDVTMPEMDGLCALREIRRRHPRLPVVMFSSLTGSGAAETVEALSLGASDYVTKPSNAQSIAAAMEVIRGELIPKVRALCRTASGFWASKVAGPPPAVPFGTGGIPKTEPRVVTTRVGRPGTLARPGQAAAGRDSSPAPRIDAVVIGSSTGGPKALTALWSALPGDLPVPVLIVQHMPPLFTPILADRLTRLGRMPVLEAHDGVVLRPGIAVLAPGDRHMVLDEAVLTGRVRLTQDPPVHSCRPAVDPLFTSAAHVFGASLLAVVLTGMGTDGTDGSARVVAAGGRVIAQDEATSAVWGMPGSVVNAGLADMVLPVEEIAAEIVQRVAHRRAMPTSEARAG